MGNAPVKGAGCSSSTAPSFPSVWSLGIGRSVFWWLWLWLLTMVKADAATNEVKGLLTWYSPKSPVHDQVLIQLTDSDDARPVDETVEQEKLFEDSRVYTRALGMAEVTVPGYPNSFRMDRFSEFRFVRRFRSPVELVRGTFYFLARGEPFTFEFSTPHMIGGHKGTDFSVTVTEESTTATLFDGRLELVNTNFLENGGFVVETVVLTNRFQAAELFRDKAPRVLEATNLVQWWLHYPAVIAPGDLPLNDDERARLGATVKAYAEGDFSQALFSFGTAVERPRTPGERCLHAALAMAMGHTDDAREALRGVDGGASLSRAVEWVIAAVTGIGLGPGTVQPRSASEWLARSYWEQAGHRLESALEDARKAVALAPEFLPARVRAAELEFMDGNRKRARELLDEVEGGSQVACAAYHSLRGFLEAADGRYELAGSHFDRAIRLDPTLGDAWLGRGLVKVRRGKGDGLREGVEDIWTGAVAEPGRSLHRSYLGKAFQVSGEMGNAAAELEYARVLDPKDPTPWLYLALLRQEEARINEGIQALHASVERGGNRVVYRSRALLDEDRAVRGANLALLYRDAGLNELGLRAASAALEDDYANSSAHLFLANSYNNLRGAEQSDLRFETAWYTEFLLANLLAPVGSGAPSPTVSANEYGRLFDRTDHGITSSTEYSSQGDWRQAGAVHGVLERMSYSLDTLYVSETGDRNNADVESLQFSAALKQQVTREGDVFLRVLHYDFESGDVRRLPSQIMASSTLRVEDTREPEVVAGYHHQWSPGQHSLVLASAFNDRLAVTDPSNVVGFVVLNRDGLPLGPSVKTYGDLPQALRYQSQYGGFGLELQQIATLEGPLGDNTVVAGARLQEGWIESMSWLGAGKSSADLGILALPRPTPALSEETNQRVERWGVYAYDYWNVRRDISVALGVSYDELRYPRNFRTPPLAGETREATQLSPKIGLIARPWTNGLARFAYARALGGVSFEQSLRLEPTQVGGIPQAYRSIIPEAFAGPVAGEEQEMMGLAFEQQWARNWVASVDARWVRSSASLTQGIFLASEVDPDNPDLVPHPGQIESPLRFEEWQLGAELDVLLGTAWSAAIRYRVTDSSMTVRQLSQAGGGESAGHDQSATLGEWTLEARFNSRTGFFGAAQATYFAQQTGGDAMPGEADEGLQLNLFGGYRFWSRRAEIRVGLLNIADTGYVLNPLNYWSRLPQSRALTLGFRFSY